MKDSRDGLTEAERALLAAYRERRRAAAPDAPPATAAEPGAESGAPRTGPADADERVLLERWRSWRDRPLTRPPWFAALRQRIGTDPAPPVPATGLADDSGYRPDAASRFAGMLLGAASAEHAATGRIGERTTAMLFALEGVIRAHTALRAHGATDLTTFVLNGLQRWLHTRGVPWQDCVAEPAGEPDGWLVEQRELHGDTVDDRALLTALTRIAAGGRASAHAAGAGAVPLGAVAALWSGNEVFGTAANLAALTHGHPDGNRPAGALGVAISLLLRGNPLTAALDGALAAWEPADSRPALLDRALHLGSTSPVGFVPGAAQLDAMSPGRTGTEALSAALRITAACPDDFTAAIAAATDHAGDTRSTAVLCGQLLGAAHGPAAIPLPGTGKPAVLAVLERLAEDAAAEFGPYPDESEEWLRRYPVGAPAHEPDRRRSLHAVPRLAASRDRFLGAVLGCAIGEALGTPVAGDSWDEIRDRHGPQGLRNYVPAGHPAGRLGSDTQLLLFSLEGTIRAGVSRRSGDVPDPSRHIQHAYQRWLHTQHLSWGRAAGEFLKHTPAPDGWLVGHRALFQTRNPGRTMMRTLIAFAKGQQPMGTPERPVSDSQGSTAVMRAVPAALWSSDPSEVFRVGQNTAALTHGDPVAYLSAGTLAFLVSRLLDGRELAAAVDEALDELSGHRGHQDVTRKVSAAVRYAASAETTPTHLESGIGNGWSAADALGIGLYAALVADGDIDVALPLAVNHSGNSATTGAVCGSLVGAQSGAAKIPDRWRTELELHDVIEQLAHDASLEFGPHPPEAADWTTRYPPT
ncbi:ADP-ribosylglycohydrolase family protein [Saccharopolyspora sp. 6V]|uniref:ADP-ribosylglycohydrolase family protein n=1 Tax=Saccharopolyspora sp. 6V TaxID=2877239 RepID=UPI001CD64071|nr:ADP-ribosylglycohydrolase family protein [Saccharopolyspora sp. 6V]MCA1196074.1 ADP-ribosylglycohydrolase family protein [Saccharopolyspora sp. 6V]